MGYPLIFLFAAAMAAASMILLLLVEVHDAGAGCGDRNDDHGWIPGTLQFLLRGAGSSKETGQSQERREYRFMIDPALLLKDSYRNRPCGGLVADSGPNQSVAQQLLGGRWHAALSEKFSV